MPYDSEALGVKGTAALIQERQEELDSVLREAEEDQNYTSLASFIMTEFQRYRDSRRNSGIEDEMFDALRSFNGEYNPRDAKQIQTEGGSAIFMNITATKCRAASSWIKDILLGKESPFSIEPTPRPSLPEDIEGMIQNHIRAKEEQAREEQQSQRDEAEFGEFQAKLTGVEPQQPEPQTTTPQPQQNPLDRVQEDIVEANQHSRDILDAIKEEIMTEAAHGLKRAEVQIADQLVEGDFRNALSDFIDDYTIFPTAVMKGPIITEVSRLAWENGRPTPKQEFIYLNKRVSPFDIYPSPESTSPNDGGLIEHIRMTPSELYGFLSQPSEAGYKVEAINRVFERLSYDDVSVQSLEVDDSIEYEKDELEMRGYGFQRKNTLHGLHFFGSVSAGLLEEWGLELPAPPESDYQSYEVEAILVHGEVIKCVLNSDPLLRRPYYAASWQSRPGSFWGRALPSLMGDIQRMCNATARALANNMGLSSGPQISLYVDRLADDTELDSIYPFKVWQMTSDPSGAGGKAITFDQPTSNAGELLKVYDTFEAKADEATGIPRYMYGQDKVTGAAATAAGLSMLLESASKTIKEAIRHIDLGVIIPRVEYQFYYNMLEHPIEGFSGDVQVVAKGSQSLTVKGAAQIRRNEFLQITANEFDMSILGKHGRASILREIAKDLDITSPLIPNNLVIKRLAEEEAARQQESMEMERQRGLEAASMQIEGQKQMAQGAQQLRAEEMRLKHELEVAKLQLSAERERHDQEIKVAKLQADLEKLAAVVQQQDISNKRNVAATLETASINASRS